MISSEETADACEKLQLTIDVCTKFKDAYFEYKAKAEGQWKLTTNALFVRLDSFLERCHDILHLTNTIVGGGLVRERCVGAIQQAGEDRPGRNEREDLD